MSEETVNNSASTNAETNTNTNTNTDTGKSVHEKHENDKRYRCHKEHSKKKFSDFQFLEEFNEEEDAKLEKYFYYVFKTKTKLKSILLSVSEHALTSYYMGLKWGGRGGFISGAVSQLFGMTVLPATGAVTGFVNAIINQQSPLIKEIRTTMGPGEK